jgi:leucyl-tRNA synthetase
MRRYDPGKLEPAMRALWDKADIYKTTEDSAKPKRYVLEYFPYPSGAAMHVGHVRNYTIGDCVARFYRMHGFNVLHPMGWDAFGLPAENYAIKNNVSPQKAIADNTAKFKKQLTQMGFSYDWSREINSSDPEYYKWTQWFFKLLFERGLAYQKDSLQWWCETDKTVLANEQVENGKCWRCGNPVTKKALKQWFFKITDYADRLVDDLEDLDWSESIKAMQRNWIGKSVGAEIDFRLSTLDDRNEKVSPTSNVHRPTSITVFTTRPDTLFGATFMVLAPEHPLVDKITTSQYQDEVAEYVKQSQRRSDVERMEANRPKTGVFTGSHAINPANNEAIPIWVADYVLMGYGTGAIMAVPAHDERDFEFAKKFDLPIRRVIKNDVSDNECTSNEGVMINSGEYNKLSSQEMREKIVADLAKKGVAKEKVNYKLRDWLISRQRYWGAPIPIIYCSKCGVVPVPDKDLPVVLPEVKSYQPSGGNSSVLAGVEEWVNVKCPVCGEPAKRETDTMDGFACSSWYFLRFADPHNNKAPFGREPVKRWLPVDDYIGGAEHAVMHLLYARMWTKVMNDVGLIDFNEPFLALRNQGMILAPDGRKMSKSWDNTIAPDDLIDQGYGADAIRIMELFIGPWDQDAAWSIEGLGGCYRFLNRVWVLVQKFDGTSDTSKDTAGQAELYKITHQTIKKVTNDSQTMGFNTAIAALMEFTNELYRLEAKHSFAAKEPWHFAIQNLILLLAPFAPHLSEALWQQIGKDFSVHQQAWPTYDEAYLVQQTVKIAIQINGKLRGEVEVPFDSEQTVVEEAAKLHENASQYLKGDIQKVIYIANKLINFVV